jgi:hypothetical protein
MFEICHYVLLETIWATVRRIEGYCIFVWTKLPLSLLSRLTHSFPHLLPPVFTISVGLYHRHPLRCWPYSTAPPTTTAAPTILHLLLCGGLWRRAPAWGITAALPC